MTTQTATTQVASTANQPVAGAVQNQTKPTIEIEGDDFDLPACGLNPNDPAFAGCESCQ